VNGGHGLADGAVQRSGVEAAEPGAPARPPSPASFLAIPAFAALAVLARLFVDPSLFWDPPWAIVIGNTAFVSGVGAVVAWLALRTFAATGRLQLLLVGCGVLTFGVGAAAAAVARSFAGGANLNVTLYNVAALQSAALHGVASFVLLAGSAPEISAGRRRPWLLVGVGASSLSIALLAAACARGLVPPFFVQGVGPTPVRQWVLGGAGALFAFSSAVSGGTYLRTRERFLYWYASALALSAISLGAFLVQHSVGSPVGWVGRAAQYVGGVYFLVALGIAARTAQLRGTSLDHVLAASLSGAEEKFRALAENAPDAILRFDRALDLLYVNRAGQRLYGGAPAVRIGRSLAAAGFPPDAAREWSARLREVFGTGRPVQSEDDFDTPDGRRFYESRYVPEHGPDGGVANVLVLSRDLTDRKRAEEALADADRRKDEFLATLSHELRNPLAPILNGVFILQAAPPGSAQAVRAREIIRRQAEHLTRLVDDLLDLTRISRGKVVLHRTRVDLDELVRRACDDHRALLQGRGMELTATVEGRPWIDADETRVVQIVGNLLQNAARFGREHGNVWVSVDAAGGRARIHVRDDGIGIAPDFLPHLFEPFVQQVHGVARGTGGLGLGLALVKGMAELHGGTTSARSEGLGRGAEFEVTFPLVEAPAGEASRPAPPDAARGALRVLVVDDNEDEALTLSEALELSGHRVAVAHGGEEALAAARAFRPEVVLCDIGMPRMSGYDVARALRADPALAEATLIALTGYAQPEDVRAAREAGFDDHVAKPASLATLEPLMRAPRAPRAATSGGGAAPSADGAATTRAGALERFLARAGHDLRAPLRHIDGTCDALLEDCGAALGDVGAGHLARIRQARGRALALVEDLLTLWRVEHTDLAVEAVDLGALALEVAADLRRRQPERQVALTVEEGLEARGDPRLLRVVLENLLGNAWKFTARQPAAHVAVGRAETPGGPGFLVRDDGPGFDAARAGQLFEPFQRLHGESEFEGTGLGLHLVRRVVERHGGGAWITSSPGAGTTVRFTVAGAVSPTR
jgi:two-component system CheB/CheR fusion protein